jgi:asparagine synthase (glutamine-hydrolysing)
MPKRAKGWCTTSVGCLHLLFGIPSAAVFVLARDPYGIRSLYYADDSPTIRFASSVKALLQRAGGFRAPPVLPILVGFSCSAMCPNLSRFIETFARCRRHSWMMIDKAGGRKPVHYASIASIYCDAETQAPDLPEADGSKPHFWRA